MGFFNKIHNSMSVQMLTLLNNSLKGRTDREIFS